MATLEEAFESIFDAIAAAEKKKAAVAKEDLTEEQKEHFILVFGQEAFNQTKIFLFEVNS